MPETKEKLLSATEVADYLGIPLATLYGWRYVGRGPRAYRVGKFIKYRPADVERWLAGQADQPRAS